MIGHFWEMMAARPAFVVVEPVSADCWFQSNQAGRITPASGDADTIMGGLACREISPITWPVIGLGADWFMTIGEDSVPGARRTLGGAGQRRSRDRVRPLRLRRHGGPAARTGRRRSAGGVATR